MSWYTYHLNTPLLAGSSWTIPSISRRHLSQCFAIQNSRRFKFYVIGSTSRSTSFFDFTFFIHVLLAVWVTPTAIHTWGVHPVQSKSGKTTDERFWSWYVKTVSSFLNSAQQIKTIYITRGTQPLKVLQSYRPWSAVEWYIATSSPESVTKVTMEERLWVSTSASYPQRNAWPVWLSYSHPYLSQILWTFGILPFDNVISASSLRLDTLTAAYPSSWVVRLQEPHSGF